MKMAGLVRRLLAWLHRRGPAGDEGARIIRKGDQGKPQPDTDPIQELVRIVGESNGDDARRRADAAVRDLAIPPIRGEVASGFVPINGCGSPNREARF
jgi:hypothetical protein